MEYNKDSAQHDYLQIALGWDAPEFNLRITVVPENETVRLNKTDGKNHIYPRPEFDHQHIPKLIEALAKKRQPNRLIYVTNSLPLCHERN